MEFNHVSVLPDECIEGLAIKPDGIYVDGTLGGAGHSSRILKQLGAEGLLIGIDQDTDSLQVANERLSSVETEGKFITVHNNFENIPQILDDNKIDSVDGILLDIGVSSYQFDEADRGFSYRFDARLDMRMNRQSNLSAYEVVNNYTKEELTNIFYRYGEEKWSKRIAEFIINTRKEKPIENTFELVEIIKKAVPKNARRNGSHPAKRVFQALRIEVNDELGVLERTIVQAFERVRPGGRMCIITFHSLEDRIVKNKFKELSNACTCPPSFPVCVCGNKSTGKLITNKPIIPSKEEMISNPRSGSAKLRVIERI